MTAFRESCGVFVTGASGLLGKAIVNKFISEGWFVLAHYFSHKGIDSEFCRWLYGDFRSIEGVTGFLKRNDNDLKGCYSLINNYGPITYRDTPDLTSDDLKADFHGNLLVAKEVTDYLMKGGNLKTVVNIGFEGAGSMRPYRKILSYAIAKSALKLFTLSYEKEYPDIRFRMISPPSLTGGEYGLPGGPVSSPDAVAEQVFEQISEKRRDGVQG